MRRASVLAVSAALICTATVWAQGGGGGNAAGGGGSTGTTSPNPGGGGVPTQPGNTPSDQQRGRPTDPFGQSRQQQPQFPEEQFQRPLLLSGKVTLDDNTPPPGPVKIFMDCDGRREPVGYTSSKGTFSVDLNDRNRMGFADASVSGSGTTFGRSQDPFGGMSGMSSRGGGLGTVNLFGCQLTAELGGYQAEPIQLGSRSAFDKPDVGTMILRRLDGVEGTAVSFTTLSAPKNARKAYDKAFKEVEKKQPDLEKAQTELEKAVAEHPSFAMAWSLLGRVRMQRQDKDGARDAFEKAVAADAKYLDPYPELARMALIEERWDDAVQVSNQLLRLNPHAVPAYYFSAVANFQMDRFDASKQAVMDLKEKGADKHFPQSHQLLGLIQAKQGLYEEAATAFRSYLELDPSGAAAPGIQRQLHEWEVLGVIKKQETAAAQAVPAAKPPK